MREIAGKMPDKEVRAKVWRVYAETIEEDKVDVFKTAECIGMVYGLDAETVMEEIPLSDLIKTFWECYGFMADLIAGRIPKSKNADGDGAQ